MKDDLMGQRLPAITTRQGGGGLIEKCCVDANNFGYN